MITAAASNDPATRVPEETIPALRHRGLLIALLRSEAFNFDRLFEVRSQANPNSTSVVVARYRELSSFSAVCLKQPRLKARGTNSEKSTGLAH